MKFVKYEATVKVIIMYQRVTLMIYLKEFVSFCLPASKLNPRGSVRNGRERVLGADEMADVIVQCILINKLRDFDDRGRIMNVEVNDGVHLVTTNGLLVNKSFSCSTLINRLNCKLKEFIWECGNRTIHHK